MNTMHSSRSHWALVLLESLSLVLILEKKLQPETLEIVAKESFHELRSFLGDILLLFKKKFKVNSLLGFDEPDVRLHSK